MVSCKLSIPLSTEPPSFNILNLPKHVVEGQKRVEAQVALVVRLERDGYDTAQAKSLLEQFQTTLALQIEDRNRILRELE
jgi:hypothetical protein